MADAPSGEVTFVFTDIVGSTALWDRRPAEMTEAVAEHDRRIRNVVESGRGYVFTTAGDSFAVAFETAADAVHSAIGIQLAMEEPANGLDLSVRIGVHTGRATLRGGDYFGGAVNRAARISSSAHARQVIVSQTTADLLRADQAGVDLLDLGVHRLRGLSEPERIHQVAHADLPSEHPPLRTVEGPGDALPVQLSSFVGRSREVADVGSLLDDHRMVTLTGSGGAGKTRLAIRVAERRVSDHPGGTRLADLAAVRDPDVLVEEVAQRFGVTPAGGESPLGDLIDAIGASDVLLVLDNCEQIVDPTAALCQELLTHCQNLRLLVTSRQRIGVTGEVVYRVPSLGLPDDDSDPAAAMTSDAVRLFASRARLVDQQFEISADNVADVAAICRQLDGIPLAIELAAARARSMSSAQILRRLGRRFALLTGADRTSIPRQETLLSAIEWSHELLDERERTLFRRLGVFADDFPLEAAEVICAGDDLDELDVLDVLAALVDKSMVATEQGADGTTRYRLLQSIRQFAEDRLEASGEADHHRTRHAEEFTARAEHLQATQRAGDLAAALRGLDEDEAEYRSALRRTVDTGQDELAGRLVSALGYLWYAEGLHREGIEWSRAVLDHEPELSDETRAGLLHAYGTLLSGSGRPDLGIRAHVEQIEIRRRLGDPGRLAAALNNLGNLLLDVGDADAGTGRLEEAAQLFGDAGDTGGLAIVGCSLGYGHMLRADYDGAIAEYGNALNHARRDGNQMTIAVATSGIGQAATYAGRGDEARPHLLEARTRFAELHVHPGVIEVDKMLGLVAREDGDHAAAARHWIDALTSPGQPWYDEGHFCVLQYAASIITDPRIATLLVGAATAAYESTAVQQIAAVLDDLVGTRARLEQRMGVEEFEAAFEDGRRCDREEAIAIGISALEALPTDADESETSGVG